MKDEPFPFPNEIYPDNWFERLDAAALFSNDHPIELDIGCGDGSFLMRMGEHFPDRNFIGVERLLGRVRKVSRKSVRFGLENVRILRIDTKFGVKRLLPLEGAARIHFLCPDPWPKKKHASRRQMCQLDFLRDLHSLLAPGGELLFKTDSPEYFEEAVEVQTDCDFFREEEWTDESFYYPQTDFEEQWLAEGRTMHRMRLLKV